MLINHLQDSKKTNFNSSQRLKKLKNTTYLIEKFYIFFLNILSSYE